MNFYGLLHISDEGRHSPNLKTRGSSRAIASYLANAVTLANSLLIDLDMVALRPPSAPFVASVSYGMPQIYDISDQVFPVFGEDTIAADLERLIGPRVPLRRWYGGEFIGGRPQFFAKLVEEIDRFWEAYASCFQTFHHQGDEVLTSAALCKMLSEGWSILDAGPVGVVGRYWSSHALNPQRPFAWVEQCFLAHLPGDKAYLAARALRRPFRSDEFRREYRWHRIAMVQKNRVRRLVKLALGRHRLRAAQ